MFHHSFRLLRCVLLVWFDLWATHRVTLPPTGGTATFGPYLKAFRVAHQMSVCIRKLSSYLYQYLDHAHAANVLSKKKTLSVKE